MKFFKDLALLAIVMAAVIAADSQGLPNEMNNQAKSLGLFDITSAPSKADWRYLIHAPDQVRLQIWEKHAKIGKGLQHWNWGWRLGWVRVCGESDLLLCRQILQQALFDKALVVRSEAAVHVGLRYAGSADPTIVTLLERAFGNKQNLRGGRPLFVLQRILYALYQIGDEQQRERAQTLAAQYRETRSYWQRLVAATEAVD